MTRQLRLIGWWDGPESGDGWPDVCGFVSGEPPDEQTVAYLRSGTVWAAAAGVSLCRLCGRDNGSAELTDGVDFCWPEGLAHYVEEHGVRLPAEVRGRKEAPPVDLRGAEDALLTVDDSWWRGQGSEPATHRPGCRHSPVRVAWHLPRRAAIWVGGVPVGDVALMARLRRLLGAGWPFAKLRAMTGDQPFLGIADGDPRALNEHAELRGFLFYEGADGLLPVATEL